jgi:zinc protease
VAQTYFIEDQSTTGWFVPVKSVPPSREAAAIEREKAARGPAPEVKDNEPGFAIGGNAPDPWTATPPAPTESAQGAIAQLVLRRTVGGVDVLSMRTGAKDIVTLVGSLDAGLAANPPGNTVVGNLVSMMLDKGTLAHDRFFLDQRLSAVGASLEFSVNGDTISFTGKCLRKDVPLLLQTLAEELRQPKFDPEEFAKAQKELTATLLRQKTDPGGQAWITFASLVYPENHPNYIPSDDRLLADVPKTTVADLQAFQRANFGPASLRAVLVGDVDDAAIDATVRDAFGDWKGGRKASPVPLTANLNPGLRRNIEIPDKTSLSVMIGQADGLRLPEADRVALNVATSVLGGGFSGHLMHVIRDKKGLTYGISSFIVSDTYNEGSWAIQATFAPGLLDRGLEATSEVLKDWYEHGITEQELAYRKSNMIGLYEVSLATTDGLARKLLQSVQAGLGPQYLDDYPKEIAALKLDQVNAAIRSHLDPDRMVTVVAGSIPPAKTN